MKWIARLFGFCGHEFKWSEPEWKSVDGKQAYVATGRCKRCGLTRMQEIKVDKCER